MWIIESIECKNLFSHKSSKFIFQQGKLIMILGENGAGKSVIIEAIHLAFTGEVYRGVNKKHFIRRSQEECIVEMQLKNLVNRETFTIERHMYADDQSSLLKLYEEGIWLKKFTKRTAAAQKYIYEKIGITQDDLFNYFIINQGNNNSFFGSTDARQKAVILRFSNVETIEKIEAKIDLQLIEIEAEISHIELSIEMNERLIENTQKNINMLQLGSDPETKEANIERINDEIKEISKKQLVNKNKLATAKLEHTALLAKLKSSAGKDYEKSLKEKQLLKVETRKTLTSLRDQMNEINDLKGKLSVQNGKVIKCPKCRFEFIPGDEVLTVEEIAAMNEQLDSTIEALQTEYNETENTLRDINEQIEKLETKKNSIVNVQDDIDNHANKIASLENLQSNNDELINVKTNMIRAIQDRDDTVALKNNKNLLKDIQEKISSLKNQLLEKIAQKEELLFQQFHFGRSGFKTFIANKSIKLLQDMTNYYLNKFNTELQVQISGLRVLANGDVRDKIDVFVLKNGIIKEPYNCFSGGQRSRIDVCGILALQRLINNSSAGGGLENLILDEHSAALDKNGQQELINILSKANISSTVIMHHADTIQHTDKFIVEMENDVSTIKPKK